ncbi:MAG: hypothetical protein HN529_01420 [Acidiferrobacteraceae bacterium]|jgi:hypothetical protein|nr:hypothetical protein [Acidiferrobacteraceae bacterium]MBT4394572.1 hypothetical protein [Acidiferrobacteraceae bacterium]MBT5622154.1 hypothetical protein [Acidiferrobacteraceae bacterium]MBT5887656.1 hypothetical protein [Acidiferrobacteraceae bacterium]MBT5981360.1 hypothetical protein [Acidiferrobacteraceae bacterium]
MYYRVTTYGFDAARRDEFLEFADSLRDELSAVDGLEAVHTVEIGEGEGMIIARYTSADGAEEAQPQIQGIMGRMAPFLTSMPQVSAGEVIWEM